MDIARAIGKAASLLSFAQRGAKGKSSAQNLIAKAGGSFSKGIAQCAKERRMLLKKADALERRFARREFGRQEYFALQTSIHKKMMLCDLECAIFESGIEISRNALRAGKLTDSYSFIRLEEILARFDFALKEFEAAKSLFEGNKLEAGPYGDKLREIHSHALEAEKSIREVYRQGWAREQAAGIMEETRRILADENSPHAVALAGIRREVEEKPEHRERRIKHAKAKGKHLARLKEKARKAGK
ncbi:MAG TPA: hypothetical protein HA254_06455 [Candidatus Diapherotrites archaeon]|uniref:Uncharacterized protein n=1 Tax=Candidatus Iainarchaeum sp. TaxID=3101447 RepID=A0A7J4J2J1_9ARCH|nr:hypothetical protein [Candidatus Diapherotrites archaeon]